MPMIFAMFYLVAIPAIFVMYRIWGLTLEFQRSGAPALGHDNQRWADDPVVEEVALLQYLDYGIGLGIGFHRADRLVAMGIEFLAGRVDLGDVEFIESVFKLP
jgi:hypothetical protein